MAERVGEAGAVEVGRGGCEEGGDGVRCGKVRWMMAGGGGGGCEERERGMVKAGVRLQFQH